jgi:malate dehydrogenase (oxaloacetate-decarboxylating)(NADP+)
VNQDRNVFGACMVQAGHADAMVTGTTRSFAVCLEDVLRVVDVREHQTLMAISVVVARGRTVLIADTSVHELPTAEQLADFASQSASLARQLGHEPRVAFLSFSNFGNPPRQKAERIREAVEVMDGRHVDFEYEGEMQADVALDYGLMKELYPFTRLSGPANILIMPALHSANITAKLMKQLGETVIGPVLVGLSKPVQIVQMGATVNDIVTAAAFAAMATMVQAR